MISGILSTLKKILPSSETSCEMKNDNKIIYFNVFCCRFLKKCLQNDFYDVKNTLEEIINSPFCEGENDFDRQVGELCSKNNWVFGVNEFETIPQVENQKALIVTVKNYSVSFCYFKVKENSRYYFFLYDEVNRIARLEVFTSALFIEEIKKLYSETKLVVGAIIENSNFGFVEKLSPEHELILLRKEVMELKNHLCHLQNSIFQDRQFRLQQAKEFMSIIRSLINEDEGGSTL